MLNLRDIERKMLEANNGISTDVDGREVLRGLDLAESNFVVAVEHTVSENVGAAESETFRELRQKHLTSRQMHNVDLMNQENATSEPLIEEPPDTIEKTVAIPLAPNRAQAGPAGDSPAACASPSGA